MLFCVGVIKFLIFGSVCVSSNWGTVKADLNPHIIGGQGVDIIHHPYMVSLRILEYHFCGASILNARTIITAGHCMIEKQNFSISVYGGSQYLIRQKKLGTMVKSIVHPNYALGSFNYDVALIFLNKPLIFNERVQPISLSESRPPIGTTAVVVGWGFINEKIKENNNALHEVFVKIIKDDVCQRQYSAAYTSNMICAGTMDGSKDACQNDSGGPLVYNHQLLGLVSFGFGCGRAGFPGVYTSIPNVFSWVYSVANF